MTRLPDLAALDAQLANLAKVVERLTEPLVVAAPSQPARVDTNAAATPPRSKVVQAAGWLRATLACGPLSAKEVYARAALAGIARRTLERAKRRLGVRSEVDTATIRRRWCWRLPDAGRGE